MIKNTPARERNKITMKNILITLTIIGLLYVLILDEPIYFLTAKEANYTIEIELLNGSKDTIITRQPIDINFLINCHSHKGNFNGCNLEAIMPRQLLLGGHYYSIRDGVINFKILKKE